jgi:hypothetical protein
VQTDVTSGVAADVFAIQSISAASSTSVRVP